MSVNPNYTNNGGVGTAVNVYDEPDAPGPSPASYSVPQTKARSDGLGNLLFHMHSVHFKPILFSKEETSLQFYEHVVVATVIRRLWCFPKKVS